MRITLIAAVAANRVIGRDGDVPWHLPADLDRFQRVTLGHTLLMGRRTFESTEVLPGRTTLVLSRDPDYRPEAPRPPDARFEAVRSLDDGVARARALGEDELFVCGGEGIYREALARPELSGRLDLTRVEAEPAGDTRFPEVDWTRWRRLWREEHPPDAHHAYAYAFELWERA
jgi:dihydrofolate reductase